MPGTIGIFSDQSYLEHDTGQGHPEHSGRLAALAPVFANLDAARFHHFEQVAAIDPDDLTDAHSASHVERVRVACESGPAFLDADTPVVAASWDAALKAAGAVVDASLKVARGELRRAFCAVRPPGHHAEYSRAMGFCLFNNIALAAHALLDEGLGKIAIVDFDVHHGNGTQEIFFEDPNVFYASCHQMPLFPGTGAREDRGVGPGLGTTLNRPLPPGVGDEVMLGWIEGELASALGQFRPNFLLLSAGFDAHAADPLAALNVTTEGFAKTSAVLAAIADEYCGGRLVSALEGGYELSALADSVSAHIEAFAASD